MLPTLYLQQHPWWSRKISDRCDLSTTKGVVLWYTADLLAGVPETCGPIKDWDLIRDQIFGCLADPLVAACTHLLSLPPAAQSSFVMGLAILDRQWLTVCLQHPPWTYLVNLRTGEEVSQLPSIPIVTTGYNITWWLLPRLAEVAYGRTGPSTAAIAEQ